jgi:RNA polymerase sigma factor (sigma-70 family)
MDDAELLRRYAEDRSEVAFAALVQRHLDRVYSVALRQVGGDVHLAEDVAQTVFSALARQAPLLARRPVLGGWLYRTTQFTAIDVVRIERRRRAREQEADTMREAPTDPSGTVDWDKFRPVIDQTLAELRDRDRDAVWLRFFEGRSFAEIGATLSLTENAARMCVDRALDKLHAALARRGITSTAAAIAAALAGQASLAAPAGLAASITNAALASAATSGALTTLFSFIAMNKLPLGITTALAVAGTTGFVFQYQANAELRREIQSLRAETHALEAAQGEHRRLAQAATETADLRSDDAELVRLRDETAALRRRLEAQATASKVAPPAPPRSEGVQDRLPRPSAQPAPLYPPELQQAGISGEVVVGFIVDAKGAVQNVAVIHSTQPEFEAAALQAVSQWQFDPGLKGGRAVNTRMQAPITFGTAPARTDTAPSAQVLLGDPQPRTEPLPGEGWF